MPPIALHSKTPAVPQAYRGASTLRLLAIAPPLALNQRVVKTG